MQRGGKMGDVRLLVGQRDPQIHDGRAGAAGRVVGLDGPGIRALGVRQAERHGHAEADHGVEEKRHPRAGLDHRGPGAPYAR